MSTIRTDSLAKALGATISISLVPICVRAVEADAITIGIIRLFIAISVLGFLFLLKNTLPKLTKVQWISLMLIGVFFVFTNPLFPIERERGWTLLV